jgi:hypothetical protein
MKILAAALALLSAAAAWAQMPGMNMPVTAEEALRLEDTLKADPDNLDAHQRLARFFVMRLGMQGMRDQMMDSRTKYVQHVSWLIAKHPEAAGEAASGLAWVRPEDTEALLALWKPVLEKRSGDPETLASAAMYYTWRDLPRALSLLQDARRLGSMRAGAQLAGTYFGIFVAASRADLGAGLKPPLDGGMAPELVKRLDASTDVEIYGTTGGWLVCFDRPSPRPEYVELGKRLVTRALAAEPSNRRWTQAMECVKRKAQP